LHLRQLDFGRTVFGWTFSAGSLQVFVTWAAKAVNTVKTVLREAKWFRWGRLSYVARVLEDVDSARRSILLPGR